MTNVGSDTSKPFNVVLRLMHLVHSFPTCNDTKEIHITRMGIEPVVTCLRGPQSSSAALGLSPLVLESELTAAPQHAAESVRLL